jgi:hypothetical protein
MSYSLPLQAKNPFPLDCSPELDTSDPLDPEASSFYQHLIGVMRWMVELGRVDIATEVSYPHISLFHVKATSGWLYTLWVI